MNVVNVNCLFFCRMLFFKYAKETLVRNRKYSQHGSVLSTRKQVNDTIIISNYSKHAVSSLIRGTSLLWAKWLVFFALRNKLQFVITKKLEGDRSGELQLHICKKYMYIYYARFCAYCLYLIFPIFHFVRLKIGIR